MCKYIGTYSTEVNFQMKCAWEQVVCPFSQEKKITNKTQKKPQKTNKTKPKPKKTRMKGGERCVQANYIQAQY